MQRRQFIGRSLSAGALGGASLAAAGAPPVSPVVHDADVVIERASSGKPHRGKVLASIAPHSDDHSIMAGGTIARLIEEGYTGYLIRTSNDEMDSYDLTLGQTVAANEADNQA